MRKPAAVQEGRHQAPFACLTLQEFHRLCAGTDLRDRILGKRAVFHQDHSNEPHRVKQIQSVATTYWAVHHRDNSISNLANVSSNILLTFKSFLLWGNTTMYFLQ